jgi:hypothetical protein
MKKFVAILLIPSVSSAEAELASRMSSSVKPRAIIVAHLGRVLRYALVLLPCERREILCFLS